MKNLQIETEHEKNSLDGLNEFPLQQWRMMQIIRGVLETREQVRIVLA
jgi:hypothetical protein